MPNLLKLTLEDSLFLLSLPFYVCSLPFMLRVQMVTFMRLPTVHGILISITWFLFGLSMHRSVRISGIRQRRKVNISFAIIGFGTKLIYKIRY